MSPSMKQLMKNMKKKEQEHKKIHEAKLCQKTCRNHKLDVVAAADDCFLLLLALIFYRYKLSIHNPYFNQFNIIINFCGC